MSPYEHLDYPFPPKAGVYAVRGGPIITRNIAHYIAGEKLEKYVPQTEFLALLMTGDGKAVGTRFGMAFTGKWVWGMKDYIDVGFMKLFDPHYLFNDYDHKGTAEPLENNDLFEAERKDEKELIAKLRAKVEKMTPSEGARLMSSGEDHEGFREQFLLIDRMKADPLFAEKVVDSFHGPKII